VRDVLVLVRWDWQQCCVIYKKRNTLESTRVYTTRENFPTYTGGLLPSLDFHINLVVVFFRNFFLIRPVQWSVAEIWFVHHSLRWDRENTNEPNRNRFGGFLPTLAWMNMESERAGLIGSALYFAIFQLLGISIFYPLVCIYYLFSVHKSCKWIDSIRVNDQLCWQDTIPYYQPQRQTSPTHYRLSSNSFRLLFLSLCSTITAALRFVNDVLSR